MKTVLKISSVLSWFNLVVWGYGVIRGLMLVLAFQNMALLIFPFLLTVIVLHSYAALQLHKSIRDPNRPLSSQTPVGIRFIGTISMFFGIICFAYGIAFIQNSRELLQMVQAQLPQTKGISAADIRMAGVLGLIFGLCISVNVMLNFRLLRWYHFMKGMM